MVYIDIGIYTVVIEVEFMRFCIVWMELKDIMLSKINQWEKDSRWSHLYVECWGGKKVGNVSYSTIKTFDHGFQTELREWRLVLEETLGSNVWI